MKLQHKLLRANVIQMVAIAVATLLSVLITAAIMEQFLLRTALSGEAEFYWDRAASNPLHPLPHTKNLVGYLESLAPDTNAWYMLNQTHNDFVPPQVRGLAEGYHTANIDGANRMVHVSQHLNKKLYLIIAEEQITELSFFFGVIPLLISLAGLYLLSWLTQRLFVSTMSPISFLAQQVEKIDVTKPTKLEIPDSIIYQDTEIFTLYQGTQRLLNRVESSVQREKRFSRDASHELRTPLAVMKGSLHIAEKHFQHVIASVDQARGQRILRSLARANRSALEMEKLIEELLLLAREDYQHVENEDIDCNQLLNQIAEELVTAFANTGVELRVVHQEQWHMHAPHSVLRVVITNIASNAMRYTRKGEVVLKTWKNCFEVTDTGEGFDPEFMQLAFQPFARAHHENNKGFGLGLSIVKRFCDHYGWTIDVQSKPGEGTRFQIRL